MHLVLAVSADTDQPWVAGSAARFARDAGATVAVVCVDEVELERLAAAPRSVSVERAQRAAEAAVQALAEEGVHAQAHVLSGLARDRILDFAEEQRADVLVVGASSRPPLASRLLGSVPLALIARSPRPVLVLTPPVA